MPAQSGRREPYNSGGIIAGCSIVRGGGRSHVEIPSDRNGGVRRRYRILGVGGGRRVRLGGENHRIFGGRGVLLARVCTCSESSEETSGSLCRVLLTHDDYRASPATRRPSPNRTVARFPPPRRISFTIYLLHRLSLRPSSPSFFRLSARSLSRGGGGEQRMMVVRSKSGVFKALALPVAGHLLP